MLTTHSDPPSPTHAGPLKSPTWSLTDLLQALEEHDKDSSWYVDRGNELCRLLARYPGLKWELNWTAFIGRHSPIVDFSNLESTPYCGGRGRRRSQLVIELRDTQYQMCKVLNISRASGLIGI